MLPEHKEVCERGFREGAISVLVATSTVATGVNLPAQRVIIRDHWIARAANWLDASRLRQMAGRAGRAGMDTKGECICVLSTFQQRALKDMKDLMTAPVCP